MTVRMILMILAVIVFILSAANVNSRGINLLALGLALWALATLVTV